MGGAVERFAHTRTETSGCYRCEAHATPSRDGRRVVWASIWSDRANSTARPIIQAYIVDAR